jgi:hypothetical protein
MLQICSIYGLLDGHTLDPEVGLRYRQKIIRTKVSTRDAIDLLEDF